MPEINAVIKSVYPGTIGEELDIRPGDKLIKINGHKIRDIIDYRYWISEEHIKLLIERNNEHFLLDFEKDPEEEMGLDFTTDLFDGLMYCGNRCVFCFVDQTPKGMRKPVYVKDDDYRLSFLYGNFITLNNIKDADLKRIVKLKLSPLYISVHSLNPEKRKLLFGLKKKCNILEKLKFLAEGNIKLHTQIVLCPGINDGEDLDNTIRELATLHPGVQSVAVVPVGVTKYRENLYPLTTYNGKMALHVINQVENWQRHFKKEINSNFVYLADEFYILSGRPFPPEEEYEGFPQIENGVGMVVNFMSDFKDFEGLKVSSAKKIAVVCGKSLECIYGEMEKLFKSISGIDIRIIYADNLFWGDTVTVTGLLTGGDIYEACKDTDCDEILIPSNTIRKDGIFLDDMTVEELSQKLGKPVKITGDSGIEFLEAAGVEICQNQ